MATVLPFLISLNDVGLRHVNITVPDPTCEPKLLFLAKTKDSAPSMLKVKLNNWITTDNSWYSTRHVSGRAEYEGYLAEPGTWK